MFPQRQSTSSQEKSHAFATSLQQSKRITITALFLVVCFWSNVVSSYAQAPLHQTSAEQSNKICDDKVTSAKPKLQTHSEEASVQQASEKVIPESLPEKSDLSLSANGLQLSTKISSQELSNQSPICNHDLPGDRLQRNLPVPLHSEQLTPIPLVEWTGSELTIRADGQSLLSVLDAIRDVTGITIDAPGSQMPEPVFLKVGPLATQDAIIALLEGSKYNYLMTGSKEKPGEIGRLIIAEKTAKSTAPSTLASKNEAPPQPELYGGQGVQSEPDVQAEQLSAGSPTPPNVPPPSVPTGINVKQMAAQSGMTTGQVLDDLQKRQLQVLDDQAASQAQAPQ